MTNYQLKFVSMKLMTIWLLLFSYLHLHGQSDCLIAHYPLDGSAFDISVNQYHGVENNVSYTVDRFGESNMACAFNGIDSYIDLGKDVGDSVRSVSLWFKANHTINPLLPDRQALFSRNTATQDGELSILFADRDELFSGSCALVRWSGPERSAVYSDTVNWLMHTWHHIVIVIDPIQGMMMYVNNVLQSGIIPTFEPSDVRDEIVALGRWGNLDIRYFDGDIDDVRVYSCALEEHEINALFLNGNLECEGQVQASIEQGDIFINDICYGVIMKSPSGFCYRIRVQDDGSLYSEAVSCPD